MRPYVDKKGRSELALLPLPRYHPAMFCGQHQQLQEALQCARSSDLAQPKNRIRSISQYRKIYYDLLAFLFDDTHTIKIPPTPVLMPLQGSESVPEMSLDHDGTLVAACG